MSNILQYKDYLGKVNYSSEDEVLHGKIEGIDDLVTYEGESVEEIKQAFEDAVDDYIKFCELCGKEPEKIYKGSFNVRISPSTHKSLAIMAIKSDKTLNQVVDEILANAVSLENNRTIEDAIYKAKEIGEAVNDTNKELWIDAKYLDCLLNFSQGSVN